MNPARILLTLTCVGMLAGCQSENVASELDGAAPAQGSKQPDTTAVVSAPESQPVTIPPMRELFGYVNPSKDTAFEALPTRMSSRSGLFLRKEACEAFQRMHDAAKEDGITLTALSATRPFGHQASIWNRKWNRPQAMGMAPFERALDILRYSSMPGSSRHHWGTDVDVHSLDPKTFEAGEGAQVLVWLREEAGNFGFVEVYTADSLRPGYQPEAWHWSYLPLSGPYLESINDAAKNGTLPRFEGFEGAELADSLRIVEDFVNGVNRTL